MNLTRIILRPDGEESTVAYPSPQMVKELPGFAEGAPDTSLLPKETVRSVILACLNFSQPETVEGGYMVNLIGQEVVQADKEVTLRPKLHTALVSFLKEQISMDIKDKDGNVIGRKGAYKSWAIQQVLEELGVKPSIE